MTPVQLLVLRYIGEHDADPPAIAGALGLDVAVVEAACEVLAAEGLIAARDDDSDE